ncbi:hypothetical protein SteCoe_25590 [Stentor coeruleus]|uniref:Importin N-terminal domain-containing protein n=1 Tax=Stentor coeruleus TaxID=5963 RepID=A0A1R2BF24_9CILI|nr:hypothetical protein SteCoe_25590 [Stentor coeruleus]
MDYFQALVEAQKGNYQSYELLEQTLKSNPGDILKFFEFFADESQNSSTRELVGVFLKNFLKNDFSTIWWQSLTEKSRLIDSILMVNDLIKVSSLILTALLEIEAHSQVQTVLGTLIACNRKSSILAIGYYVENARTIPQVLTSHIQHLLQELFKSTSNVFTNDSNLNLVYSLQNDIILALQFFQHTANHIPPSPALGFYVKFICANARLNNESIRIEAFKCIVDALSYFYDFIGESFSEMAEIVQGGLSLDNEQFSALSLEFWNVLCDIEKGKVLENPQFLGYISGPSQDPSSILPSLPKHSESILNLLLKKIQSENSSSEILKICSTIESISDLLGNKISSTLPFLGQELQSSSLANRKAGFYFLGSILSGLNQNSLKSLETELLPTLTNCSPIQEKSLQKSLLYLICKFCEHSPKIIERCPSLLYTIYSSIQDKPSKLAVNALFEISESGVSLPNTQEIVDKMFEIATKNKILNSFNVIRSILEHLQAQDPYFTKCTPVFASSLLVFPEHFSSISTILRVCFERICENALIPMVPELFNLLSQTSNEEYLIALSCISRYKCFIPYINIFLIQCLNHLNTQETSKTTIICLAELVRNLENSDWLRDVLPKLTGILQKQGPANVQILEMAADIVSLHTEASLPHLASLVGYAEHCMALSLNDDNDDEESLEELREAVVCFFEGFLQGVGNFVDLRSLANKIDGIVKYCLIISDDKYSPNENIVGGILGIFADIIMAFETVSCSGQIKALAQKYSQSPSEIIRMNADCVISNMP